MNFVKYSASGNDFVIFHTIKEADFSELAKNICDRFNGVGADGLIAIVPHDTLDYKWLFYNSDGSTASMCGNGSRACAHYAYLMKLAPSSHTFLTMAGEIKCDVQGDIVKTQLTKPIVLKDEFEEDGFVWWMIDTGVPHLVCFVTDLDLFDKELARKMRLKYDANVNFAKLSEGKIFVRTYERGVEDETLACGTGMAACFLRAKNLGLVQTQSKLYPKSGEELIVSYIDEKLFFEGRVKKLFTVCDYL